MIKSLFVLNDKVEGDWDHWLEAYLDNKNFSGDFFFMSKSKLTILDKVLNKLRYPLKIIGNINLNKKIRKNDFELIILMKPVSVSPYVLKNFSGTIFCIPQDNMIKRHNSSELFIKNLKYFDSIFIMHGYEKTRDFYKIKNSKNIIFWYHSYSQFHHKSRPVNSYKYDVTFIGTYEKVRLDYINFLSDNGISVNVFGNNWRNISNISKNVIIHNRPVLKEEYVKTIQDSKINLSFLRKIQDDTHTTRTFEIPACGGFMITERSDDHKKIFKENIESVFFDNKDELLKNIRYYLDNEEKREAIIKNSIEKLKWEYTYSGKFKIIHNHYMSNYHLS